MLLSFLALKSDAKWQKPSQDTFDLFLLSFKVVNFLLSLLDLFLDHFAMLFKTTAVELLESLCDGGMILIFFTFIESRNLIKI